MKSSLKKDKEILSKNKRKSGSLLELAKHAVPLGKKDFAKNFDKYFEESLK